MLTANYDLKADVLKVGHHGSSSSSTRPFLKAVSPKYAVISVGKDNDYGHPHKETINRLFESGISVFRTDESGTIIFTTDGDKIEIEREVSPQARNNQLTKEDIIVYITKSGKKYHVDGCDSLCNSKIPIKLSVEKKKGYGPCKGCNPPQ